MAENTPESHFKEALKKWLEIEREWYRDKPNDDPDFRVFLEAVSAWDETLLPKAYRLRLQDLREDSGG